MKILGISCFYHDSAACLVTDGDIVAAAQEERFTRIKHDAGFPARAVEYCLKEGGISIDDVDIVVFYDKPFLKFERLLETYFLYAPKGLRSYLKAMSVWLKKKLWIPQVIARELGYDGKILYTDHHQAHSASAFFASPFEEAVVLTVDGVGEWTTTSWSVGRGNTLSVQEEIHFPHSLGLLYSAFTYYTGFKVNSGEYKVMGLAPYGTPVYADRIREHLIDIKPDGSFKLNMEYFDYPAGLRMTNNKFHNLFGGPPRKPESEVTQKEMDIASSLQVVTEEVILTLVRHIRKESGIKNLCLAGGVALNCVANGKILKENIFDRVWVQPAAGDAGGALGSALAVWYQYLGNERTKVETYDRQKGTLLGPEFSKEEILSYLKSNDIPHRSYCDPHLMEKVALYLSEGATVGWFQGRMEFGPRSLGSRSILGDARSPDMQTTMNLKIKYRESFRPFAPAVLKEDADEYFDLGGHHSPYMLFTAEVEEGKRIAEANKNESLWGIDKLKVLRSVIPAVTHVDYSARVQTVDKDIHPRFHALLNAFKTKTGSPVVVNTSFNVRGEPIVCTPEDAFRCFMRTDMDYLVLGNFILSKTDQPAYVENKDWRKDYALD